MYTGLMKIFRFVRNIDDASGSSEHLAGLCLMKCKDYVKMLQKEGTAHFFGEVDNGLINILNIGRYIVLFSFTDGTWTLMAEFAFQQALHSLNWKSVATKIKTDDDSKIMDSVFSAFEKDMKFVFILFLFYFFILPLFYYCF